MDHWSLLAISVCLDAGYREQGPGRATGRRTARGRIITPTTVTVARMETARTMPDREEGLGCRLPPGRKPYIPTWSRWPVSIGILYSAIDDTMAPVACSAMASTTASAA